MRDMTPAGVAGTLPGGGGRGWVVTEAVITKHKLVRTRAWEVGEPLPKNKKEVLGSRLTTENRGQKDRGSDPKVRG